MEISKFSHNWFGLAAALVVGVWAVPAAAADQCSEDGDCPKGFTCETSAGVACPEIDCADGEECEKAADCVTEEVRYCASIDCSADSDCAEGMLCETVTSEECSGGGGTSMPGDPGSGGDADPAPDAPDSEEEDPASEPAPVECTTSERNYCVYRYELPCESATDCGSGFTCETRDSCACTSPSGGDTPDGDGSEPSPGDDADLPAPAPDDPGADGEADDAEDGVTDDCGCPEDPGPGYCQLEITECAADADCAPGMTCQDNGLASCSSTPDGGTECVSDPEKLCMPPYSGSVPVYGYDVEEDRGDSGAGEGDPTGPADPDPPATDDVDGEAAADGDSEGSSASGGGCAVGSGSALPTSTWASLVLMLGAAALRRRRRA